MTAMVAKVRWRSGSLHYWPRWDRESTRSQEYSGGKPGSGPGNFPPLHSVFLEIFSRILGLLLGKQTHSGRNPHIQSCPKCPRKTGFLESSCFHILILFHTSCWYWKSSWWSVTKFHSFKFLPLSLIIAPQICPHAMFSADILVQTPFACRSRSWQGNFWLFQAIWHTVR